MVQHTSLHTLVYGSGEAVVARATNALRAIFPESRFVRHGDVDATIKSLQESSFDLVVLVFEELGPQSAALIEYLHDRETGMPVSLLIASSDQDLFHELFPDLNPDWTLAHYDDATDRGLGRAFIQAIRRFEIHWERDHLQRAMQSSMLQYRSLFDEVPDIIFLCDRAGLILDVNSTASRIFNLPKERMVLKSIFDTFGIDKDDFGRLMQSATQTSGPIEDLEVEFHPPGGEAVTGLTHLIPMRHLSPGPVQFQGVIKDITHRKRLEERLRDSEVRYKTLYELGKIAAGSLNLEEVCGQSLELIRASCRAAGGLVLCNQRYDELNCLAASQFDEDLFQRCEKEKPVQIGRGLLGRLAIGREMQQIAAKQFGELPAPLREWLERREAAMLLACPLGNANLTIPTTLVLLAFRGDRDAWPDKDLVTALTKSLEMGINNCHHYANAREAEEKYRKLWDHAPAFFFSILKGGIIFEVNQTAAQGLGCKFQDIIGRSFADFILPEDRPMFHECHQKIVEEGTRQSYEVRLLKKDGAHLVANMNSEPLLNHEGEVIGEKAILYDITRNKMLEASLREHSENLERKVAERTYELTQTMDFLNGILEGSTEYAIFGLNEKGRFVHFNRGAQLILHYDPEEMVRHRSLDHMIDFGECRLNGAAIEKSAEEDLQSFLRAVDRNGSLVREAIVRTGDGERIIAQVGINRLKSAAPGKLVYVGIARDITEEKRNQEILRDYNENLQAIIEEKTRELDQKHIELIQSSKLATLGEMATGIAHELNQPLSGIRTRAQLLAKMIQRGSGHPEKILSNQTEIMELVDRITRIIQHMRVFARQDEQRFAPFNVVQSIEGALSLLREQLRLHAIDIDVRLFSNPPMVEGEPSQIEQVLLNLISNARDSMDEKGEKLKSRGGSEAARYRKRLSIALEHSGENELCIRIADNGLGMDRDTRERLFEPFFTTKPVGHGTGLGLSISYGIISKHNGRIEVSSRKGEGAEFRIYLPVYSTSGSNETSSAPSGKLATQRF